MLWWILIGYSFGIYIDPPRIPPKNIGDTFRVRVNVINVAHLYGYDITVQFDSLVLKALEVKQGSFLSRFGNTFWFPQPIQPDKVQAVEALLGVQKAGCGNGTLFSIKFKVKGEGNSLLRIGPIKLASPASTPLPYFCVVDGWYGSQTAEMGTAFNITPGAENVQELPSICWDNSISRYIVVWQDKRSGNDYAIYGQQVNPNGTLYGSFYIICDTIRDQLEPSIAYNPSGFFPFSLVVWTDYRFGIDSSDIYGRLIYGGTPVTSPSYAIAKYNGFQTNPQIASSNSLWLVVFQDHMEYNKDTSIIYGQLIHWSGGTQGDRLRISPSINYPNYNFQPAVAGGNSNFLVTWSHSYYENVSEVYYPYSAFEGRIINTDGTLGDIIEIEPLASGVHFYYSSCAFDGTNYLVIWSKWSSSEKLKKIYGRFVSSDGQLIGNKFVIYETTDSMIQIPKVYFDQIKGLYVIIWNEKGAGIDYIKGRFVTPGGSLIGEPFILRSAPYQQVFPTGAYGGSSMVVWQDFCNGSDYDIWGYVGSPLGEPDFPKSDTSQNKNNKILSIRTISFFFVDKIKIEFSEIINEPLKMKIYNSSGSNLFSENFPYGGKFFILNGEKIKELKENNYFLFVSTKNKKFVKKIVKIK